MDDVHNPRLRERPKKDSSGVTSGQTLVSTSVVSSSRNKRKRQGSQEVLVHARGSPADDLEETTEDTEMVASEDDDDPPPPIIPRRPGKLRPQGKVSTKIQLSFTRSSFIWRVSFIAAFAYLSCPHFFTNCSQIAEDGITVDLPAVPRKARTGKWQTCIGDLWFHCMNGYCLQGCLCFRFFKEFILQLKHFFDCFYSAILKRPQETLLPPPADIPSHQPSTVIASTPAPSSTPSSIASLKPGRRTVC